MSTIKNIAALIEPSGDIAVLVNVIVAICL
jgi:hypothetical protein